MFERPDVGERALLVHLKLRLPSATADLSEFKDLVMSAGAKVQGTVVNSRDYPDPKYLIGKGKVLEIQAMVRELSIELVIVNHNLTPSQERNLEKALSCRVLDRTGLILDIFAQRARTAEGKLQVELAQLRHLATRLVRGWTHLERQKGGIGLRGPGETQLEVDRRLIRQRIKSILSKLEKVKQQRAQSRRARQKAQVPTVALVGYTNAGKSTLFNRLTTSDVYVADQLFATLDPTLRTLKIPIVGKIILADTVGFIRDLPHDLVDAFRATLEETREADLLLHVIDCHDDLWREQKRQVESVLQQIGALHVPILEVYNKIDLLEHGYPGSEKNHEGIIDRVSLSALSGLGIEALIRAISIRLSEDVVRGTIKLQSKQAKLRALLYDIGAVDHEAIDEQGDYILDVVLQRERWLSFCKHFDNVKEIMFTPWHDAKEETGNKGEL